MRTATKVGGIGWRVGVMVLALAGGSLGRAQQGYYGNGAQDSQDDPQYAQDAAQDPPSRVARVSTLLGTVSIEPASVNEFSVAEMNYPMTTGDRIYADTGANAELETGQLAVRLGQQTDLTVTGLTDTLAQFGLAQGSVHLRAFSFDPNAGGTVEIDTPNVAITLLQAGDVRVDADPQNDRTIITVFQGAVQLNGDRLQTALTQGQSVVIYGADPVQLQGQPRAALDGLDHFSADRDWQFQHAEAAESQYLSPDTIGAADLAANGEWDEDGDYGPVWYPTAVAAGWAPYTCGRWTWIAPWGWTWVDCAAWGFAPFHYGRWAHLPRGWGWIPGPPRLRPVYSPALVVFVGGAPGRGAGVTAWFPLGPREPYVPWYHATTLYTNRVNVTNIYTRNEVEVRNTYNQRTVDVYAHGDAGGQPQQYANRSVGTVAMQQSSFAAGRAVAQGRVDAQVVASAPVVPHPLVSPERQMVVPAPARALPPRTERPVLAVTERASGSASPQRQPIAAGSTNLSARPQQPMAPVERGPAQGVAPNVPRAVPNEPVQRSQPVPSTPPPQRSPPQPRAGLGNVGQGNIGQFSARPLVTEAVPPAPRPSFELQREAIQASDPGRPLGPQQLQNLREQRPAGPPQQREPVHAAPPPPAHAASPPSVSQPSRR